MLTLVAGHAEAADARYRLAIAPNPFADALIALGVQANISIVGVSACGGGGRATLSGVYGLEDALSRLLAGAPCTYRLVDGRTVQISAAAPARPAPEPVRPPVFVAELVVTATKRPASLNRLPAGVSAIPYDQIRISGAADAGQTTGQLAGVLSTNLGPGRDKLLIRGLSDGAFTGRTRSTVSTYLDETPLNYNAPDPDLRLVDIERVEVIRGPQGALYGSGAISGIYRIVTRKPDLTNLTGGVAGLAGWTDGGDPSREIEGYLSVPVLPGRAAVRLVAYHDLQGGYLDDVNLRLANVDKTVRDGARLAVRLQINDAWSLDALAAAQRLRSDDTQYTTLSEQNQQRANRVREAHANDFAHVGLTARGDLGWASLSSSIAYVRHTYSSQYDASAVLDIVFNAPESDLGLYEESARVSMLVQDLVLSSTGAGPFTWLVGAYASNTIEDTPSSLGIRAVTGDIATAYRENRKDRLRELAVYGEASWRLAPGWIGSLGGRVFQSDVKTASAIAAIPPGRSRAFENEKQFTGLSPKISLQREFDTGDLIYALITEGYRPGGFNSSGFLPIRANRTIFVPDRLRNYEIGAKVRLLDRRLGVRTAAYYDDWTNIQTDQYRPSGLAYTANVGDARIIGLEAEVGYDWDFGLSVLANGLLSDSKTRRPNLDFALRVTDELPGVPKLSGGLLAIYQRPLAGYTLRITGQASYVGRSALSFDAALPPRMGDYLRAKFSAEIDADAWSAGVFISNPTNDTGDTFAYGNPFSFGQVRQVTPQRPRTVGLRLAAAF
ncbi:TonB-dependent receptor [Phenylobacterium sp.]|uniref:TonB-dependent receptor n=1 Tax=Phenylobacterium sp. TaxID=1871053 RepID=UPI003983B7BB